VLNREKQVSLSPSYTHYIISCDIWFLTALLLWSQVFSDTKRCRLVNINQCLEGRCCLYFQSLRSPRRMDSFSHDSCFLGQDKKPRRQKHREITLFNEPQCSLATPYSSNNPKTCNIWGSSKDFADVSSLLWCSVMSDTSKGRNAFIIHVNQSEILGLHVHFH